MFIRPTYKEAIGFLVLILVLIVRPQGIFGQARTV
jgi:branched-subunit amino acid ABC-type transport system permease component